MKTIKELEEECRAILKPYGLKLPKPWQGHKAVWHVWHEPRPMYFMTYRGYLERVTEIHKNKSEEEKPIRFAAMKPVRADLSQLPKYAEREKAYAEWEKTDAAWRSEEHTSELQSLAYLLCRLLLLKKKKKTKKIQLH